MNLSQNYHAPKHLTKRPLPWLVNMREENVLVPSRYLLTLAEDLMRGPRKIEFLSWLVLMLVRLVLPVERFQGHAKPLWDVLLSDGDGPDERRLGALSCMERGAREPEVQGPRTTTTTRYPRSPADIKILSKGALSSTHITPKHRFLNLAFSLGCEFILVMFYVHEEPSIE